MQVYTSQGWQLSNRPRQELAEGHDRDHLGLRRGEGLHHVRIAELFGLEEREAVSLGCQFHGRGP
jgi:hypothetical protein